MNTTAVINNFKRPEYFKRCLESIKKHYPSMPVIVVSDENLSRARNDGLRQVRTPYALFIDDDMEFTDHSNLAALETLMDIADIAGGQVKGLVYEGNFERNYHEKTIKYVPIWHQYAKYHGVQFEQCDFIPNFFIGKTEKLLDVEWCEEIRIAWEHIDFFLDAKASSLDVVFSPDASVKHEKDLPISEEYLAFRADDAESKKKFFERWGFEKIFTMDGDIITPTGVTRV